MRPFILILLTFFLSQCNQEQTTYQITVNKNGDAWKGGILQAKLDSLQNLATLTFISRDGSGIIRDELTLRNITLNNGVAYLDSMIFDNVYDKPCVSLYTYMGDGSTISDVYLSPQPSLENYVNILNYDVAKRELEGEFQFTLVRDVSKPPAGPASTSQVTFANGYFLVRLE